MTRVDIFIDQAEAKRLVPYQARALSELRAKQAEARECAESRSYVAIVHPDNRELLAQAPVDLDQVLFRGESVPFNTTPLSDVSPAVELRQMTQQKVDLIAGRIDELQKMEEEFNRQAEAYCAIPAHMKAGFVEPTTVQVEALHHQLMTEGVPQVDSFRMALSPALPTIHKGRSVGVGSMLALALSAAVASQAPVAYAPAKPMLNGPRQTDRRIAQWKRERR